MHFYKTTKATNDHTKSEEDKYNTMSLMCVIKKKLIEMNLHTKQT